jgi:GntR family transcriptional regulator / MocR family aminotransferase
MRALTGRRRHHEGRWYGHGWPDSKAASMPVSRTSSELDLFLELVPGKGRRAALERALREAIRAGRLPSGSPLPSSRALARDLHLARSTVTAAYAQLVAAGYLSTRPGAGTWVASGATPIQAENGDEPLPPSPRFDLRPGLPDLNSFPRTLWLRALGRALARASDAVFAPGDPRGRPELRRSLAEYLARSRGVVTSPDRLLICNGFCQGFRLVCHILEQGGARRIALEDPCVFLYPPIARAAGLEVIPLPVDGEGLAVERLTESSADAVLVTPANQCPLGATLSPRRRAALIEWAQETGNVIIEDDYDGEFRYDRQPVGALQGLDPAHVVYAGTTSKTLAPGIRLGWLALPPALLSAAVEERHLSDRFAPVLDQLALAELIDSGGFDSHVRRMRLRYRRRRDRLIATLRQAAPQLLPAGIAAGLHIVLELPDGLSEEGILRTAEERSIGLYGLESFRHGELHTAQALVIGYGAPPEHNFEATLTALASLLADSLANDPSRRGVVRELRA